jgi:predicted  nucleic acid-binding Zn-ribbon protein
MSTTPLQDDLSLILDLQGVDLHIQRVKKSLASLDDGTKLKGVSDAAAAAHAEAVKTHHHVQGELKDSELKLSTLETKVKNYQNKLYQGTVTNPKELTSIEKEIAMLGRQRSDLDGRILELMDDVDTKLAAVKAAESVAVREKAAYDAHVEAYKERKESLTRELAAVTAKRPGVLAAVTSAALLKKYEDLRARTSGQSIAHIVDGACGGCHMRLPSFIVTAARAGAELTTCENCGRILVP